MEGKKVFDNIYYEDLKYREYTGKTSSNTDSYANTVIIKGLRLKGQIKVVHGEDGDTTTCTIVYKTKEPLVTKSFINGREIMECVPVAGFGLNCGYLSYVK
jgi:hypothetical protein